jgi:hypothetical protein
MQGNQTLLTTQTAALVAARSLCRNCYLPSLLEIQNQANIEEFNGDRKAEITTLLLPREDNCEVVQRC